MAGAIGPPSGPSLLQISYIASVFGLSLAANVFIWYRVSGGMFNPSVSHSHSNPRDNIASLLLKGLGRVQY